MLTFKYTGPENTVTMDLTSEGISWPEIMIQVVAFLNGCGFVIDHVKAEEAIGEWADMNADKRSLL